MIPGMDAWWLVVRRALLAFALLSVAALAALHPAVVARYVSSDGELAASTERALFVAQMTLAAIAAGMLLAWWRWRRWTPRRERIVLGGAAIAASLLVSVLAAEAGLTIIHRFVKPLGAERHYFFEYDATLGWRHRPQSLATFKNALVRIDADGLRVSGRERGPFRARALLLGDSQAFGDGVAAEDTFGARLEASIPSLRVLNASVIGYGTDQQLLYFEQQAPRLAPEITVVALNAYDLRDNLSTRVRSGYAKPRFDLTPAGLTLTNVPVPGNALGDRLQRMLQHGSHLYRLSGRFLRRGGAREGVEDVAPGSQLAHEVYPGDGQLPHALSVTAAILDRFAESTRRAGSRLVVLFLPYQMDFGEPGPYTEHTERLVRLLEERSASGHFRFVDARRALAAGRPETLFLDAMHLSPEGHRRVAALLEGSLGVERLISRTYEN